MRTERAGWERRRAAAFLLGLGLAAVACTSASTRVALQGDLPSLKAAIADAERKGELDPAPVQELAEAVLTRELSSSGGPNEQFPPIRPCVKRMRPVLEDVAAGSFEFAAPAAMALIDGGFEPLGPSARREVNLVVLARQAVGASAGTRRRAFMLHGDAEVRRAALLAARDGADVTDTDSLLDAARLDPDPEARANAVQALGQVGGARAVLGLLDLWAVASTEQRRDIVLAWSAPPSFGSGGERELVHAVEATGGEPAVVAALLLSNKAAGPPGLGTSALLRFITGTQQRERLLALDAAPWQNPELRAAITAARSHQDPATRIISLSRLIEHGAIDAEGILELRKLSTASSASVALAARATLAQAGDESVKTALRADLVSARGTDRTLAALALMELEDWAGAARALADDSPAVRRTVACQMLAAPAEPRRAFRPPVTGSLAPALVSLLSPAPAT
jgi:hypothetical protein